MIKYLKLDLKPKVDLTMIRVIRARTGYRCKDIRRNRGASERQTDRDSWFSAKFI